MKIIWGFSSIFFWEISEKIQLNLLNQTIKQLRTWTLKATIPTRKFPQRGVVGLHMEPNRSYCVMSEAPTDHCCTAVEAHTHNFWSMQTHNSNCQQIKTGGEKSLQMFPGNKKVSKWLKLQCWGNFFCWWTFRMKQWFRCLCPNQPFWVYEPRKCTKHLFKTIKLISHSQDVIYFILCPELNLPQKSNAYIGGSQPARHTDHKTPNRKEKNKQTYFCFTDTKLTGVFHTSAKVTCLLL